MPSFDVVSEVDLHEIRNAVDQAIRELRNRFDFRGVDANIELEEQSILLSAPEEFQLGQIKDILRDKMTARNVDSRALTPGSIEGAGKLKRQSFALAQGIDKDSALPRRIRCATAAFAPAANSLVACRITGAHRDRVGGTILQLEARGQRPEGRGVPFEHVLRTNLAAGGQPSPRGGATAGGVHLHRQ